MGYLKWRDAQLAMVRGEYDKAFKESGGRYC
jgi:hypothetical protein